MRVKINDISLNYELEGGGQCLVLTHGLADDLTLWSGQMEAFAKQYQVLAYDVRGYGQSDKPREGYSLDIWADDLHRLLSVLGIKSSFLLGFSAGGVITLKFALAYPDMVRALILVASSSEVSPKATQSFLQRADLAQKSGMEALDDGAERRFAADFIAKNPDVIAQYKKHYRQNDPHAYAQAARAMSSFNLTQELGKLTCPTLLVVGEQDRMVGVGGSVIMQRQIKGSQLKLIKGCGHDIPTENPEVFNKTVLDFLTSL